ncbi:hypothetical protein L6164_037459 [Bauhinia variegata]|uniref:Uncharacterized protein n=1 Tax=Bauhinia variegata TaxID=167791 RepID=A0ACB9KKF8_BAUVA|nr:hypothetical protein L6164_037459 [Bauhinia variegata]
MEKITIFNLFTLALAFLALLPKMESQVTPPLLCLSQVALANYACVMLPHPPGSPPFPPTPFPPPPSPPEVMDGHGQGPGRSRQRGHQLTPQEDKCCRWVKEVDSQCVCEILIHLPSFLARPLHQYTVKVGELCEVTYSCGGLVTNKRS